MNASLKIDTSGFERAMLALAKISGQSVETVLQAEVSKVIERTIQLIPAADVGKIRSRSETALFSAQPAGLYNPKRRTATPTKGGYIVYALQNKYPNDLWASIQLRRKQSLQKALRARGLAKQSFLRIAEALGLRVKVPGYVAKAVPSTGQQYNDISTTKTVNANGAAMGFVNAQPTVNVIGGGGALQTAINGRTQFFLQNMARGVFQSLKNTARAYPGLKITEAH